jgi:hypothetical protein
MPYRTLDDRIDGVVITFADFTTTETLEAQLREKRAALERQVAKQPLDTDPSREKVTATPAAGFPTKNWQRSVRSARPFQLSSVFI